MNYRKWLYSGAIILSASLVAGVLGIVLGIHSSFNSLNMDETAGIGAVGGSVVNALFSIIGSVFGLILIAIGGFKAYQQGKLK
ncbi:MAG: hypothetical protein ACR2N3_04565 [Pyrinomonadaceae bacterium]